MDPIRRQSTRLLTLRECELLAQTATHRPTGRAGSSAARRDAPAESGQDINDDIGALVKKGLPVEVQQALDSLRVIGNNALHPGELDLRDDIETALALFGVMNYTVEQRIAQPKKLQALYAQGNN